MSRNKTSVAGVPKIHHSRSLFDLSFSNATTIEHGKLTPLCRPIEVLPGDTFSIDVSSIIRMNTPITPVMSTSYFDVYFFFVPNRIVFDKWQQLQGENDTGAWTQTTDYTIPKAAAFDGGALGVGSIGHYFGLPNGIRLDDHPVNELPLRAYVRIWNDFFRDQNFQNPILIQYGTSTNESVVGYDQTTLQVNKLHDVMTSVLPGAQKGPQVTIPLGEYAPVIANDSAAAGWSMTQNSLKWTSAGAGYNYTYVGATSSSGGLKAASPANLVADLKVASAASINTLRQAFAAQAYYEQLARGGSRYIEVLRNIWNVDPGDARLQRPEYLGGKRIPINVDEIANQTGNSSTGTTFNNPTQLGSVGAKSKTIDVTSMFTKSFTEHGMLIVLGCARAMHGYTQGLDDIWEKTDKFSFYIPAFANIGEVSLPRKSVYYTGTSADEQTFGFQEGWWMYRTLKNMATGYMDPAASNSLKTWTYYDLYTGGSFAASGEWLKEPKAYVDRTLNYSTGFEYIADFFFKIKCARMMPMYSIPANIDHF